jgi:hypothetical protein
MTNYANENLKGFAAMWAAKIVMAIVEVATTINKALGGEDQAPNNNESKATWHHETSPAPGGNMPTRGTRGGAY